jgi:hypothetical protein
MSRMEICLNTPKGRFKYELDTLRQVAEVPHRGRTLRVVAFSDYRVQDIKKLVRFIATDQDRTSFSTRETTCVVFGYRRKICLQIWLRSRLMDSARWLATTISLNQESSSLARVYIRFIHVPLLLVHLLSLALREHQPTEKTKRRSWAGNSISAICCTPNHSSSGISTAGTLLDEKN